VGLSQVELGFTSKPPISSYEALLLVYWRIQIEAHLRPLIRVALPSAGGPKETREDIYGTSDHPDNHHDNCMIWS
jgi:hypothetical protein